MKKQIVALTAVAALTAGAAGQASASSSHTVEKGDTLWAISKANNVTVQELKDWNSLSSHIIYPSQEIKVSSEDVKQSETYTVASGDTLSGIAKDHGTSVDKLYSWNGLSSDLIFPGDQLTVAGGTAQAAPAEEAAPETVEAPAEEAAPVEETAPAEEAPAEDSGYTESEEGVAGTGGEEASSEAVQELTVTATAYTAYCNGCSGVTRTGIDLRANPNQKVIAVDPNVIPLGSKVWVEGYGEAIAGDTGGAIKGNKIDLFIPSQQDALNYGVQEVQVKILE
ncbi:LysM peptidoglycan-binding domain-containing protein [Jeotgalibacillus proteolyticus]|uniref:3D domain-containing protein n=1 Tax=Jeotgalibacillus proteolyticus TaxID=2082395 RepID=UPI003CEE2D2B